MITWQNKLEYLGMPFELISFTCPKNGPPTYEVKVYYGSTRFGLCGFGHGETLEKALEDAVIGFPTNWNEVSKKITEQEWNKIAHI